MVNNENFFSKEFAWLTYSYRSFFLFYFLSNHIDFHYHLLPNYHLYTARSLYTHVRTQDTFSINHFYRVWKSAENIFLANDILAYGIASYFSQYRSSYFTLYSFLFPSVRPSCCRTICFCFFVTSKESSWPCSSIYLDQTSKPVFYFWANPTLCFLATNPTLLFWMASPSRASPLRWYPSSLTTFSQYFPFVQRFGVGNRVDLKLRFSLFVPLIQKILSWWDVYVVMCVCGHGYVNVFARWTWASRCEESYSRWRDCGWVPSERIFPRVRNTDAWQMVRQEMEKAERMTEQGRI